MLGVADPCTTGIIMIEIIQHERTFAGVVGAEGIGLKYSSGAPAAPSSASPAAGFGVFAVAACGVDREGVARLLLPGVLKDSKDTIPISHLGDSFCKCERTGALK